MESSRRIFIIVFIIIALWSTKNCSASSERKNLTKTTLEDDEDLSSISEKTPFRERYRRLIPYMTYYLSNNYVPQSKSPPSYQSRILPPITKRRFQYSGSRISNAPGNILGNNLNKNNNNNNKNIKNVNQYYVSPLIQQNKFIPSVQYDPKDMDNEEYFTPVIHNAKSNFENYQTLLYQRFRTPRPPLTQTTTAATSGVVSNFNTEQQQLQFTTIRPTTVTFTPKYGDILLRKEVLKSPVITKQNLSPNFYQRPTQSSFKFDHEREQGFSTDEFEPLRFFRPQTPEPFRLSEPPQYSRPRKPNINLNHIVKSLQLTNQLPETLNADNIDESIKTLVEILGLLNSGSKNEIPFRQALVPTNTSPKYGDYVQYENRNVRPNVQTKKPFDGISRPIVVQDEIEPVIRPELNNGPYHVNIIDVGSKEYPTTKIQSTIEQTENPNFIESTTPNSYKINDELDEDILGNNEMISIPLTTEEPAVNYPPPDGVSSHTQNFPPTSVKYGATRGKPDVDYPAYATIPKTSFSCTTQRYKGFFGDPDTGCQVWHYCDLNGGKSSFLCPNGTIFSQVALTCDWWFNVKCESTTQLYVLNERLYKYILPVMPKFPEDFSGPEVDRYLELKFKEMETKLKEKKLRKHEEELNKVKNSPQVQIDSSDIE